MPRGHYLTEAVKDAIWVLRAEVQVTLRLARLLAALVESGSR